MNKWINLAAMPLLLVLGGCSSGSLFFSTYTKVGLDMSITDGVPTQAMFGIKRFEGAIIPVKEPDEVSGDEADASSGTGPGSSGNTNPATNQEKEAMSVFAAIELENSWISGLKIRQVFATGPAAVCAADKGDALSNIIQAGRKGKSKGDSK